MFLKRLFANSGVFPSYSIFSTDHFMFLVLCEIFIILALFLSQTMDKDAVLKTVRRCTGILWILEIAKIIFNLYIGNADKPNNYIPLYFCSIPLYCGLLSGYIKGRLKRLGDVFLMVGGIVGGVAYIVSPCTTAGTYPAFHFVTIQSFIHHSVMVYLGILFIITNYIDLNIKDMPYYTLTVVTVSIIAYIVNLFLGTNLMFVSRSKPGTIVEIVYNMSPEIFPAMITFWQAVPPFILIYAISRSCKNFKVYQNSVSKKEQRYLN